MEAVLLTGVPAPARISIDSHYLLCMNSCDQLRTLLEAPNCAPSKKRLLPNFVDLIGRLRVWAGDTGAHRSGRSGISLDHRLREASHVHARVTGLLQELDNDLKEAIGIFDHGESEPLWQISIADDGMQGVPPGPVEEGGTNSSELENILSDIEDIVSSLYQLSIAIRNPAARDRLQKIAAIKISDSELERDIQLISHKFPNAPRFLIERLGKASTRRRQLMKYYRNHHDTIPRNAEHPLPRTKDMEIHNQGIAIAPPSNSGKRSFTDMNTESSMVNDPDTASTVLKSQATVPVIPRILNIPNISTIGVSSDEGDSETSDATSKNEQSRLDIPPLPSFNVAYDGQQHAIQCPYCFTLVTICDRRAWKKHVFRDLQPYICTHLDCPKPEKLYDSEHEWYEHELQHHRREWFCNDCSQVFLEPALFERHLKECHEVLFMAMESNVRTVTDRCERAKSSEEPCTLCGEDIIAANVRKHLAHHLQELALFTLPHLHNEIQGGTGSAVVQVSQAARDIDKNRPCEDTRTALEPDYDSGYGRDLSTTICDGLFDLGPLLRNETTSTPIQTLLGWNTSLNPLTPDSTPIPSLVGTSSRRDPIPRTVWSASINPWTPDSTPIPRTQTLLDWNTSLNPLTTQISLAGRTPTGPQSPTEINRLHYGIERTRGPQGVAGENSLWPSAAYICPAYTEYAGHGDPLITLPFGFDHEDALLRMPWFPPAPESYTLAAQQFPPELLYRADIPDHISIDSPDPDTIFYFRYIRNALQALLRLRQKFLQLPWVHEIKDGWYDSNLWPHFIDYLFSRSSTLSLLRRELLIIPGQCDYGRYDGVFRCIKRGFRFDLGVIKVSRFGNQPSSDMKAVLNRKIVGDLQSLLGWARKKVEDPGLQVVGVLCSGWPVTIFRMSYDTELKYVVDQQHFTIEWDQDFHKNLEIMRALVRHVEIMEQTAAVMVSKGEC